MKKKTAEEEERVASSLYVLRVLCGFSSNQTE
jgi:hypothetical protein